MVLNIIYFYILFFAICSSALGVILAPRMYMAVLSLFLLVCFTSLMYFSLNAIYLSVFQFILCGLILSAYIFLLLKKIGRINLGLKLAPASKIIMSSVFIILLATLSIMYFYQEFDNSLYAFFNASIENSFDSVNFKNNLYPLALIGIFVFVSASVLRVFLDSTLNKQPQKNEDKE